MRRVCGGRRGRWSSGARAGRGADLRAESRAESRRCRLCAVRGEGVRGVRGAAVFEGEAEGEAGEEVRLGIGFVADTRRGLMAVGCFRMCAWVCPRAARMRGRDSRG